MGERDPQGRNELLKIVCHEVRGALAPVADWAHLLQRGALGPEETAHAGEVILRSLQILARLAGDLAAIAEAEVPDLAFSPAPIDVRDVVLSVIRLVGQEAALKGVDVHVEVPSSPVPALGDAVRLAQVVCNLVGNAVKFTPPAGKVTVELSPGPDGVRIVVKDSGVGISPEFLPHVFDKFSRESPQDVSRRGSGLGLHLVKRLVDLHGGTIHAYSAGSGRGSRFVVTLPLARSVAA